MKKIFIATLCVSAFALTACDKKPADASSATDSKPAVAAVTLSTDNATDIKSDLAQIQTLSTNKAKEALDFQSEVMQAAQKGDKAALEGVVNKMKTYVTGFNKELDGLALKSTEVVSVRDKIKESNNLGIEMSEAGLASPPNPEKVKQIQTRGIELQKSLMDEMQALQAKANTAP
ncbi:hypothetical protein [Acinetobacter rongchengensis]|uniref:Lipoprotein n=1 Tax=Acinetobacter rongchengensis TaxID=2419601 RepID=A0A3A8F9P2_9GAMM|nr:hypothetical protein [Acinetobacter rongchengensis]RKG37911.1 hypothetical protein D7V20_09180 [Acinetobacter rongchengensis]